MDTGASRDAPPAWTNAGQVSARRAWSRGRGTLTAIGVRDRERLCLSAPRPRPQPGRGAERRLDKANCQLLHPIAVTSRRFAVGARSLPAPSAPACIHGLQHLMRLNAVEGIITERQQYRAGMLQAVRFRWAAQHFPRRRYLGSAPCRVMIDASGHERPMTQIRIHDTCCLTLAHFHSGRTPSPVNTPPLRADRSRHVPQSRCFMHEDRPMPPAAIDTGPWGRQAAHEATRGRACTLTGDRQCSGSAIDRGAGRQQSEFPITGRGAILVARGPGAPGPVWLERDARYLSPLGECTVSVTERIIVV